VFFIGIVCGAENSSNILYYFAPEIKKKLKFSVAERARTVSGGVEPRPYAKSLKNTRFTERHTGIPPYQAEAV